VEISGIDMALTWGSWIFEEEEFRVTRAAEWTPINVLLPDNWKNESQHRFLRDVEDKLPEDELVAVLRRRVRTAREVRMTTADRMWSPAATGLRIPDDHYPFRFELGAPYGRMMTRGLAVKQKDELRSEEMISYTIVE